MRPVRLHTIRLLLCLTSAILICAPIRAAQPPADPEVSVIAEGSAVLVNGDIAKAEDEAISDAKRNAVEKALGVLVKADTLGLGYQVAAEIILTHSEGYISDWSKVPGSRGIENVHGSELLTIKIDARVKLVSLITDATDIGPIYDAVERPRIMVQISDVMDGETVPGGSTCGTAVMRALKARGFEVVDSAGQGAEVSILGTAKVMDGPTDDTGAVRTASAVVDARVVYTDTGQVLYTAPQIQGRGASFGDPKDARLKALRDAGDRLVRGDSKKLIPQILPLWVLELQDGRVYKVIADGVSAGEVGALKNALRNLRGHVEFVGDATYTDKRAIINVRTKLTPEQFRHRISAIKIGKKTVEVIESSARMIRIRVKTK